MAILHATCGGPGPSRSPACLPLCLPAQAACAPSPAPPGPPPPACREQEEREARKEAGLPPPREERAPGSFFDKGSFDTGDPYTTNLFVGNLAPDVDEQVCVCLCVCGRGGGGSTLCAHASACSGLPIIV